MSEIEIKGLTFTALDQIIRFINQLREVGDQLKGSIFPGPMGVFSSFSGSYGLFLIDLWCRNINL